MPKPAACVTVDKAFWKNSTPVADPVLETVILPLNMCPTEFHASAINEDPLVLNVASPFQVSATPLPKIIEPAPVLFMIKLPWKVFPPELASFVPPVFVLLTVPLKVEVLK